MVGSIANIYQSIERLDDTYLQTTQDKTLLLNPVASLPSHSQPMLFLPGPSAAKKYYTCPSFCSNYNHHNVAYVTDVSGTSCPSCTGQMTKEMLYMDSKSRKVGGGGFVNGVVTYTISDDLTVTVMSTISIITLFNNFNIKDLGSLEERTVKLGLEEGLELLKASLQSKTVLTDVFLRRM